MFIHVNPLFFILQTASIPLRAMKTMPGPPEILPGFRANSCKLFLSFACCTFNCLLVVFFFFYLTMTLSVLFRLTSLITTWFQWPFSFCFFFFAFFFLRFFFFVLTKELINKSKIVFIYHGKIKYEKSYTSYRVVHKKHVVNYMVLSILEG